MGCVNQIASGPCSAGRKLSLLHARFKDLRTACSALLCLAIFTRTIAYLKTLSCCTVAMSVGDSAYDSTSMHPGTDLAAGSAPAIFEQN